MTKSELSSVGVEFIAEDRCFGRLKAQELTSQETDLVGGGDTYPPPPPPPPPPPTNGGEGQDVVSSGYYENSVSDGTGDGPSWDQGIGNTYT